MKILTLKLFISLTLSLALASGSLAAEKIQRQDLGRSVKLLILVDKVMQPEADWVTKEWMIKETAEAGFNVFSPRSGHDRLDEVKQVNEWCRKYGIYHIPWMRGSLAAPDGAEADGKRLVWASGNEQPVWSVNSDEFWEWTSKYIVEYAKISSKDDRLIGVFLDYENYYPGREADFYSLSYDNVIMGKFAQAKNIELPELKLAERKNWLDEKGLHDEFSQFQIEHWRERCRALRKAVDQHDPRFQFCIYPAPGSPFMVEATYPEWATQEAPLILADASTYSRPSLYFSHSESLEGNREKLLSRMQTPEKIGIPFMYSGGIDPIVRGADPEFSGKNAVMISEITDGYWIFYEGPTYTKQDHADYWKWFTWANKAIASGNFAAQNEPRETPDDYISSTMEYYVFKRAANIPELIAPEVSGEKVEYDLVRLRGENMLIIAGKAGQSVELLLKNQPVAYYNSKLIWELRTAEMGKLVSGTIPHGKSDTVKFTPEKDGIYLLGISSGPCAYSVISSNAPVGLYSGGGLSLIYSVDRLYFRVPDGVEQFILTAKGSGVETVRVNVFDPSGNQVATGQTTTKDEMVEIQVTAGHYHDGAWSLEFTRADESVIEDHTIKLDPKLPPVLSLDPGHLFKWSNR